MHTPKETNESATMGFVFTMWYVIGLWGFEKGRFQLVYGDIFDGTGWCFVQNILVDFVCCQHLYFFASPQTEVSTGYYELLNGGEYSVRRNT